MDWATLWPPFGLSLRCGPLEMHPVRFDDMPALIALIDSGIIADDVPNYPMISPFGLGGYTLDEQRDSLQFWWSTWANLTPGRWAIPMTAALDGVIVGVQDIMATDFPTLRSAETGSWLAVAHQGRGTGTLMRQVIAAFAFDHLGARELHSGAFHDNARSLAVGRKAGYVENGRCLVRRGNGEVDVEIRTRLLPDQLVRPGHPLEVSGLVGFLEFLGLDAPA
ncbi:MAG: GNAT family N-acetyltransferase [Propionibacterium sp.]|nr:GNAT family N-acetyltransferase [Propionibacterium sp.]